MHAQRPANSPKLSVTYIQCYPKSFFPCHFYTKSIGLLRISIDQLLMYHMWIIIHHVIDTSNA